MTYQVCEWPLGLGETDHDAYPHLSEHDTLEKALEYTAEVFGEYEASALECTPAGEWDVDAEIRERYAGVMRTLEQVASEKNPAWTEAVLDVQIEAIVIRELNDDPTRGSGNRVLAHA